MTGYANPKNGKGQNEEGCTNGHKYANNKPPKQAIVKNFISDEKNVILRFLLSIFTLVEQKIFFRFCQ